MFIIIFLYIFLLTTKYTIKGHISVCIYSLVLAFTEMNVIENVPLNRWICA